MWLLQEVWLGSHWLWDTRKDAEIVMVRIPRHNRIRRWCSKDEESSQYVFNNFTIVCSLAISILFAMHLAHPLIISKVSTQEPDVHLFLGWVPAQFQTLGWTLSIKGSWNLLHQSIQYMYKPEKWLCQDCSLDGLSFVTARWYVEAVTTGKYSRKKGVQGNRLRELSW